MTTCRLCRINEDKNKEGYMCGECKQVYITIPIEELKRSEERRVGKECRSRWSPYH